MGLTSELSEEALRNASYSKQLRNCLFLTLKGSSLKSYLLPWSPFFTVRQTFLPALTIQVSFLPAKFEARLYVLVSVGVFHSLAEIDQSVPQANQVTWKQTQEEKECTHGH